MVAVFKNLFINYRIKIIKELKGKRMSRLKYFRILKLLGAKVENDYGIISAVNRNTIGRIGDHNFTIYYFVAISSTIDFMFCDKKDIDIAIKDVVLKK